MLRPSLVLGLAALSACTAQPQPISRPADSCALRDSDVRWIQNVLDAWARASRDFLDIGAAPLPRTVVFDASCVWHMAAGPGDVPESTRIETPLRFAGRPVPVQGLAHDGVVPLPNGASITADIIAVAMPHRDGNEAFLVLALPDLWRRHAQASRDPHLAIRISSVALHEMVHTRQLPDLRRRVDALEERFDLPAHFDDDVVEERFRDSVAYRTTFEAERDLLYEAVGEADPDRTREMVSEALSLARTRHERFFAGGDEVYARLEGLFLNMEGIAEWVRFKHHQADRAWPNDDADIIAFLRGQDNSWSQDEGLALALLLDEMVPDWTRQLLDPTMPSPLSILRDAVAIGGRRRAPSAEGPVPPPAAILPPVR